LLEPVRRLPLPRRRVLSMCLRGPDSDGQDRQGTYQVEI